LTARVNQDVGPTRYSIDIIDTTTGNRICHAGRGTICRSPAQLYRTATTHRYVARIESPLVAHSASLSVRWADGDHLLGAIPSSGVEGVTPTGSLIATETEPHPGTVDLSQWAPPVAWQDGVGSCTSWASGYYYRYWLRKRAGLTTPLTAPMFLYSQLAKGKDTGSTFKQNLDLLVKQGIDTAVGYWQGDTDFTTQPTSSQRKRANSLRITGYTPIFVGQRKSGTKDAIKGILSSGKPILITVPIFSNWEVVPSERPLISDPQPGEQSTGWHALFATGYDDLGLWVLNSWGPRWGHNGWAELSWAFVERYAADGYAASSIENPIVGDYSADFERNATGSPPAGWALRGTNGITPVVRAGNGGRVLAFPPVSGESWDRWALKDRLDLQGDFTITVKLRFADDVADRAGLTLGWKDATWDRIDIQPNVFWDNVEFRATAAAGQAITLSGSGLPRGGLRIDAGVDYWLRVKYHALADGGELAIYWSTDDARFTKIATATGASLTERAVSGLAGVGTAGPNMPAVWFDDFEVTLG
jgi:hypothetical protein